MESSEKSPEPIPSTAGVTALMERIEERRFGVAVLGLGYVGIPLALTASKAGFPVFGFDVDQARVDQLNRGESSIKHIPTQAIQDAVRTGQFVVTADFSRLNEPDAIIIAIPTPLTRNREPDLRYIEQTAHAIAARLRAGQIIVLESTTWPGTTEEVVQPSLERTGLKSGRDFFRLLARAGGPGQRRFQYLDNPEDRGWRRAGGAAPR